jgi:hypothetical protein
MVNPKDIGTIRETSIRMIPFDLGVEINDSNKDVIISIIKGINEKYPGTVYGDQWDTGKEINIPNCVISERLLGLRVNIFDTGIGVMTFTEKSVEYRNDSNFSIKYRETKRNEHKAIKGCDHDLSKTTQCFVKKVAESLTENNNKVRKTKKEQKTEKCGGNPSDSDNSHYKVPYVFSMSFFDCNGLNVGQQDFDSNNIPNWLKPNIMVMLDPALLDIERSKRQETKENEADARSKMLNAIDISEFPHDYDSRRYIASFMSWSTVIVFGDIDYEEMEEYVSLEIGLQSNWHYFYRLNDHIPNDIKTAEKMDWTPSKIRTSVYEIENRIANFTHIQNADASSNMLKIQKGLMKTSELIYHAEICEKKLENLREAQMLALQLKREIRGDVMQVVLFVITILQVYSVASIIVSEGINWPVVIIMVLAICAVVAFFIHGILEKKRNV